MSYDPPSSSDRISIFDGRFYGHSLFEMESFIFSTIAVYIDGKSLNLISFPP